MACKFYRGLVEKIGEIKNFIERYKRMEVDVVELENGKNYAIVDTIEGEDKYLFLVNIKDAEDLNIRKVIVEDGKEYLVKLDNEEEFDVAMRLFHNKHNVGA